MQSLPPRRRLARAKTPKALSPLALLLEKRAAVAGYRIGDDLVVGREGSTHRLAVGLPQPCRSLNIGEQECDRPRGQVRGSPRLRHPGSYVDHLP